LLSLSNLLLFIILIVIEVPVPFANLTDRHDALSAILLEVFDRRSVRMVLLHIVGVVIQFLLVLGGVLLSCLNTIINLTIFTLISVISVCEHSSGSCLAGWLEDHEVFYLSFQAVVLFFYLVFELRGRGGPEVYHGRLDLAGALFLVLY
jgi:hypothetical protein